MRVAIGFAALCAIAVIVGSAALVVAKEDQPQLALNVEGVPGYVYYNRPYDITVEYTNLGGDVSGPVELLVQLPETFALAENIEDPTRHGERLVWTLDGLDKGESGSVRFAVQGTLPEDLTNAVYDLPGYEGHTAFVEGFQLGVNLKADGVSAEKLAIADTGATPVSTIEVTKACDPVNDPGSFAFVVDDGTIEQQFAAVSCGGGNILPLAPGTYTLSEVGSGGTDITDYEISFSGDCSDNGNESATFVIPATAPVQLQCTVTNANLNAPSTGTIIVHKDCDPNDNADGEFEITLFDDDNDAVDSETVGCNENATFNNLLITDGPFDAEETETEDGFVETGNDCDNINPGSPTAPPACTIENTEVDEEGTIIIEKDVDPEPDSTDFSFSDNIPGCSIGTLSDDGAGGLANSVTCSGVTPGNYQVSENASGYILVDIDCDDPDGGTTTNGSTASINLDDGETILCVFHNVPPSDGSITISKETNPDTDDVFFDFDGELGDFDLEDDDFVTFINLDPGAYDVTENEPSGWNLVDIVCSNADVTYSGDTVTIDLDPGEHVSCEFVNQKVTVPVATPTKTPVIVIPAATATPTKTAVPPVVGPVRPPSAGDGGLLADDGLSWAFGVLSIVAAGGTAWVFIQRRIRRSGR